MKQYGQGFMMGGLIAICLKRYFDLADAWLVAIAVGVGLVLQAWAMRNSAGL